MAYCTLAQLENRYSRRFLISLSDREDVSSGMIDEDLFARAISDADALIDGYLAVKYRLPLSSVPEVVVDLSQRVSIYYAHSDVASDKITKDYEIALRQLKDISKGDMNLTAEGVETEASGASEIRTNDPERPMTAKTMKGFI